MKSVMETMEICFWDTITPMMYNSPVIQKIIREGYFLFNKEAMKKNIKILAAAATTGFAFGWIAVFVISMAN